MEATPTVSNDARIDDESVGALAPSFAGGEPEIPGAASGPSSDQTATPENTAALTLQNEQDDLGRLLPEGILSGVAATDEVDHDCPQSDISGNTNSSEQAHPFEIGGISIPSMSPKPTEEEKAEQRAYNARLFSSACNDSLQHDTKVRVSIAISYVDAMMNGGKACGEYFGRRLRDRGLSVGGSKKVFAAVIVVNCGLDVGCDDPKAKKAAINTLQEMATALEGLDRLVQKIDMKPSYDPAYLKVLVDVINKNGGRTGLAMLGREMARDETETGVILLDPVREKEVAAERAEARLLTLGLSEFVLACRKDGQLFVPKDLHFDDAKLTELKASAVPSSPLLSMLHELGQLGMAVTVGPTDKPVDRHADPKAPGTKMRQTNAHIVLRQNRDYQVVIAPIHAAAGVVIHCRLNTPLLQVVPPSDVVLVPNVHRRLMANLTTPLRRGVLDIVEVEPNPGTTTVYRTYRLTSPAARKEEYRTEGHGLSLSWQFAKYNAADGGQLLDVREGRNWKIHGTLPFEPKPGRADFQSSVMKSADRLKIRARKGRALECEVTRDALVIAIDKGDRLICFAVEGIPAKFYVHAADFLNVLKALDVLDYPTSPEMTLALDDMGGLIRLSFSTQRGAYEVFMPRCNESGTRLTHGFEPLRVISQAAACEDTKPL